MAVTPRFVVDHEEEDTFVGDTASEPEAGEYAVVSYHPSLPAAIRRLLAEHDAKVLNDRASEIDPNGFED